MITIVYSIPRLLALHPLPGQLHDERTRYVKVLTPLGLPESNVVVGVRGVLA